jgi:predicted HD superfamily hydrolase involved in NAD metabolism
MAVPAYDEALRAVFKRLEPDSAEHCVAVAETAARLAETYDVDVPAARIAGLLHDWSRDEDPQALIERCRDAEETLSEVDRAVPYLVHARCGALDLQEVFPDITADILDAVRYHTTGRASMENLDKVIYIADMIEPRRGFPGVEELRAAVGEVSLEELYARAYAASILHLVRGRRRIHPDTVEAWNAIVGGERQ